MRRSARQPDRLEDFSFLAWATHTAGDTIARNPLVVGGCTAFLVTLSYVSANALWYQPHFHDGAFFSTRQSVHHQSMPRNIQPKPLPQHAPRIPVSPTASIPAAPQENKSAQLRQKAISAAKVTVLAVQAALTELKYYDGPIDGLMGPQTRKAVADFQKAAHLDVSGNVDAALLDKLNLNGPKPVVADLPGSSTPPQPEPRPVIDASLTQSVPQEESTEDVTKRNIRIQAGLKAFGNKDMQLDGVIGPQTKAAIREFQSLFGLPVTGEPDDRLLAKMRQAGLTN